MSTAYGQLLSHLRPNLSYSSSGKQKTLVQRKTDPGESEHTFVDFTPAHPPQSHMPDDFAGPYGGNGSNFNSYF